MKRFSFKLKLFSRIFQIFLVICSLFYLVMKIRLDTSLFFAERERKRWTPSMNFDTKIIYCSQ